LSPANPKTSLTGPPLSLAALREALRTLVLPSVANLRASLEQDRELSS